jgi:hypothetical protein
MHFDQAGQLPPNGYFKLVSQDNYRSARYILLHLNRRPLAYAESQRLQGDLVTGCSCDRQALSVFSFYQSQLHLLNNTQARREFLVLIKAWKKVWWQPVPSVLHRHSSVERSSVSAVGGSSDRFRKS